MLGTVAAGVGEPIQNWHSLGTTMTSKPIQRLAVAAAAVAASLAATSASAAGIIVTNVGVGNGDNQFGTVTVSGYGQPWTTPVLLTDTAGQTYVTFCDDLQHDIYVTGGQQLPFELGQVRTDGFGNPLTESTSNRMGQIADIGIFDFEHGDLKGADAAQAAIWSLEYASYGWTVSASDSTVEHDLLQDLKVVDNHQGWATGLISESGAQSQILGGVPEPATWAMLILGVAMIGIAARRRNYAMALA
jgi:hypothetical protein